MTNAELAVCAAYLGAALLAIAAARASGGGALIWPANAIAAALLIRFPSIRVFLTLVLVYAASVAAHVSGTGYSIALALSLGMVNVAEVGLMTLAYRSRKSFPIPNISIYHATHMTVIYGLVIPALSALPGGLLVQTPFKVPLLDATLQWWCAHALGACLFGPPIILFKRQAVQRLASRGYAARNILLTLISLAFCYVAIRYIRFPLPLMGVPLLIVAFSVGGFGASVLGLLFGLTIIGSWMLGIRPSGLNAGHAVSTLAGLPIWALIATVMPPVAVGLGADDRRRGVRALRASAHALAEERERLNTTLRVIADAVITTDADRRITYMNAAAQSILGQALPEVEARRFDEVAALTDPVSMSPCSDLIGECMALGQIFQSDTASLLHRPNGSVCYVTISVSPVRAPGEHVTGTVIVMHDDTERYHREREWSDRARRDPLTGLANRFEFERRANRAFERARLLNVPAAVVAIDLDRFKAVNDAAGHAAGDAVLRRVAGVLSSQVRRSDMVARLGGDEFALILENCTDERIGSLAEHIWQALNPLETKWENATHFTGASIGVAIASERFQSELAWFAAADQACYEAKRAGRGRLYTKRSASFDDHCKDGSHSAR